MLYKPFRFILYLKTFLTIGEAANLAHKFTLFRDYFYFDRPRLFFYLEVLNGLPLTQKWKRGWKIAQCYSHVKACHSTGCRYR